MEVQHQCVNPMAKFLEDKFKALEDGSNENGDIVRLRSHKKKVIMFALPNLPGATGQAYTIPNVRKGFMYNGQLDAEMATVPSFQNLINTFHGEVSESCLDDREAIIEKYFEEMYMTGTTLKTIFDTTDMWIQKIIPKSQNLRRQISTATTSQIWKFRRTRIW